MEGVNQDGRGMALNYFWRKKGARTRGGRWVEKGKHGEINQDLCYEWKE